MRRFYISILVLLAGVLPVRADSDRLLNSLKPVGYVSDFANVMNSSDRAATEKLLAELAQKTGAQVSVVTLKSLEGGQIDDFASRLFKNWGIGQKGKDNGILLLGATGEGRGNRLRIEVGYGLEGVLPDAAAGRILDSYVLPGWNQGQYGTALANGAVALAQQIATGQGVVLSVVPDHGSDKDSAIQRQQMEIQQQKEERSAQVLFVTKILAVCAVLCAILCALYLARHWLKPYWGLIVVGLIIAVISISVSEYKISKQTPYSVGYDYGYGIFTVAPKQAPRYALELMAREMYGWRIPRDRGYGEADFPEFYRGVLAAYDKQYNEKK